MNDWSKKTLKERMENAKKTLLNGLPEECWDLLLGGVSQEDYRKECHGKEIICCTDYVDGVAVLIKFQIGCTDLDDFVAYHALLVQGKGVYLPNHLNSCRWYRHYYVGEDLRFSETREDKKETLKKDISTCLFKTKALADFLENSGYKTLQEFIDQEAKKNTKKNPKKQLADGIISKLAPITKEMLLQQEPHVWDVEYSYSEKQLHYSCSCGREFCCELDDDSPQEEITSCTGDSLTDCAGRNESYHHNNVEKVFLEYCPEAEVFVWRQAIFKHRFVYNKKTELKTTFSVPYTIILGEKLLCVINDKGEQVSATALDDVFPRWGWRSPNKIIKLNDVDEYYDTSFIKYSGAKEAWEKEPHDTWSLRREGYFYSWIKNPCVEQLIKAGFPVMAKSVMANRTYAKDVLNLNKTKATDIIGLPKPFYNLAKEQNMTLADIARLKMILKEFPDANVDAFQELRSNRKGLTELDINTMVQISQYGISFKQIADYFKEVKENQFFFDLGSILLFWRDSLKMAKDLDMRFRKDIKYPKSLKLHHDKLTFYTNQLAEAIEAKHFDEAVEDALQYEYAGDKYEDGTEDKFFISIPKTPQELIDEGDAQCHCVASYLDSVSNKACIIAFLRKKEEPDESYFTIEIRNNKIMQLKGFSNVLCCDEETLKFIKKWMKVKRLKKSTSDF